MRGKLFQNLILRELGEFSPYPELAYRVDNGKIDPSKNWTNHFQKDGGFIHKQIFENIKDNRDFILGLNPDLVYYVSQIWEEVKIQQQSKSPMAEQFCEYWRNIVDFSKTKSGRIRKKYKNYDKIEDKYQKWKVLVPAYENSSGQKNQTYKD